MSECLDANVVAGLVDRSLAPELRAQAELHIADCNACRMLIAELARSLEGGDSDDDDDHGEPLAEIGRYQIRGIRGRGAMGTIYEAHDPKLDRLVAIKVMRADDGSDGSSSHARMLREARALARLAHPNVVPVFDVGELGEDIYIAMELIDGQTLREWLTTPRESAEIIAAFCEAGRGLAAAHNEDMVHRDFKPDNVIVGDDDRVRVVDFGLVRASGTIEMATSAAESWYPASETTRTGTVVGTPAYMAPEQHMGEVVDHRADQFSFAVALYEALFEQRPFEGKRLADLAESTARGELKAPPSGSGVAKRVQEALARALSAEPSARFPRIDDLISELEPVKRRWLPVAVAIATSVALAATVSFVALRGGSDECRGEGDVIWSAERLQKLRAAVVATGHPDAAAAADRIADRLAVYQSDWTKLRDRGCRATYVEKTQPRARYERQLVCLSDRRDRSLVIAERVSAEIGAADVDELIAASARLPAVADCNAKAVGGGSPLPPPSLRDQVEALRSEISRAYAEVDLAGARVPAATGKDILDRARDIGFVPLLAEALTLRGRIHVEQAQPALADASFREAVTIAAEENLDVQLASLWIEITNSLIEQGRYADAVALTPVAEAAMVRANVNPRLRARGLHVIGEAFWWQPDYARALEMMREASVLIEETYGEEDVDLPFALSMLAEALLDANQAAEALTVAKRSTRLAEKTYGTSHSVTGWSRAVMGMALAANGEYAVAEGVLLGAIDQLVPVAGGHPAISWVHEALGATYVGLGDFKRAVAQYKIAVEKTTAFRGPADYRVSLHLASQARAEFELGNIEAARELLTRSADIRVRSRGAEHIRTADSYRDLAALEYRTGNEGPARAWLAKAETIYRNTGERLQLASLLADLALALDAKPATKASAIEVARDSLKEFQAGGDLVSAQEVREWLAERGVVTPQQKLDR